ncbi:MAG TPA: hypothetical protein VF945_00355, partial [Polyangia bacterium]
MVGIAIALIAAFVGSTIFAQRNAARLDVRASDVADNAAPSITELAAARTELRNLEIGVGRYLRAHTAGTPQGRIQLAAWHAAIDGHLRAYRSV